MSHTSYTGDDFTVNDGDVRVDRVQLGNTLSDFGEK